MITVSKNVVGHVPFNWSKLATTFLHFPNCHICIVETGKWENRGAGSGLEMSADNIFYRDSRVTNWNWLQKDFKKLDNSVNGEVEKCIKYKHLKIELEFIFIFSKTIRGVCYKEVNLTWTFLGVPKNCVRCNNCLL